MNFRKILLIQPMHEKKKKKKKERTSISFPWGLATLAGFYQEAGYDVKVLDGQAMQQTKEALLPEIDKFDFDIVGITSFSTQYPSVKLFAKYIKRNRNVPVIVGGPLATYQAEMLLKTTDTDVCVIGEGEIAGIEILKSWKNLVDKEFLDLIKNSNCVGMGYGIESGSQKILNNMNKKITVKQIESAMKYTQQLKVPIKVQLIFGYPGEDETTLQETIDLFRRIDHPGRSFNVITPIPGSKLYDD